VKVAAMVEETAVDVVAKGVMDAAVVVGIVAMANDAKQAVNRTENNGKARQAVMTAATENAVEEGDLPDVPVVPAGMNLAATKPPRK